MGVTKEEMLDAIGKPIIPFDEVGVTPKYIAKTVKALTKAKEIKVLKIKSLKKGPNGEILEVEEIAYSKPLKDNPTIVKGVDLYLRVTGGYAPEKGEFSGPGGGPMEFVTTFDKNGNGNRNENGDG
jgi:hypothetical protein